MDAKTKVIMDALEDTMRYYDVPYRLKYKLLTAMLEAMENTLGAELTTEELEDW